jgi:MFS family permease
LSFIDGSVVNVALPAMQSSLNASLGTMQWVVNAYMLTLASLILLGGSAGDRFGRRRVFIVGLLGFTAASFACAIAPSALWLIGARTAQGAAAALMAATHAVPPSARGPRPLR